MAKGKDKLHIIQSSIGGLVHLSIHLVGEAPLQAYTAFDYVGGFAIGFVVVASSIIITKCLGK